MLEDTNLNQILDILVREFRPKRVFLFGSRATGTAQSGSDYDLALVVDAHSGRLKAMNQATMALKDLAIRADVFVYTQHEFDALKDELSSIPETAVSTGREIELG